MEGPLFFCRERIVSSAISLAFCKISLACSLASLRIRSLDWSIFSRLFLSCSSKVLIRSLYSAISRRYCSMVIRLCSKLVIKSSKLSLSSLMVSRAASIIESGSPSFLEIAKALLFPGIPINKR